MINQDKKIKELLKGNFEEATPSLDFTDNIMNKIAAQEELTAHSEFEYEPVISRRGWILIGAIFLGVVFLGLSGTEESQFNVTQHIPDWNFDFSIAHSQLVLSAVLSIFTLLLIDRFLIKSRLS